MLERFLPAAGLTPLALFLWRRFSITTPSLQFPILAPILDMEYQSDPPRLSGDWDGRQTVIVALPEKQGVRINLALLQPSKLRVEIGPKELVEKRSGIVVPDPVHTGDPEFEGRFLARVNDKEAGLGLIDPVLRQRLLELPHADILGQAGQVSCLIPELVAPETAEQALEVLTAIAGGMEEFPL